MKKVESKIKINATPETVIAAFTDPKMLNDWWGVERQLIQLRPGGIYSLAWKISESGFGYISTGIIDEYIFDKKLIIRNFVYFNPDKSILGPLSLSILATPNGNSTELYVCQDGYQKGGDWDWYYEAVRQAWPKTVEIIKNYLEKTNVQNIEKS